MNLAQKVSSGAVALVAALAVLFILTNPSAQPALTGRANAEQLHAPRSLIVPVFVMSPAQLDDNWGAARSQGRAHARAPDQDVQ
jgi:hypothetical protein